MKKTVLVLLCLGGFIVSTLAQVPLQRELIYRPVSEYQPIDVRLQDVREEGSKSVTLAVVLSLVLPGTGEWYAGDFSSGKYFLIADGSLWVTFGAFQFRGDWLREDARSFATTHAGAQFSGKDDDFDVNVGDYRSTDEYNQVYLRDREYDKLYATQSFAWRWDTDANRSRFRGQRIQSDQMYENAKFVVGALVINRLISAFSAGRAAARSAQTDGYRAAWQMGALVKGGLSDAHGIELRFSREF